jgi:hypothetical protein
MWRSISVAAALGMGLAACTSVSRHEAPPPASGRADVPLLELRVGEEAWADIRAHREEALAQGSLNSGAHPWEDARFALTGEPAERAALPEGAAEIRLKGDWNDHLETDQWSFRVKLKKDGRWMGKKEFSVMRPAVRGHLGEYVYHRLLLDEDVLHPAYDFAAVRVADRGPWWYAVEEHFRKELVEDRGRREGVLLKFDEEALWDVRRDPGYDSLQYLPFEESARIVPFGASALEGDTAFARRFAAAAALLEALHRGDQDPGLLVDRDRWARYLAVVDLTGAYHNLIWHNLRFYADPVRGLLEPVAYDGHTQDGIFDWVTLEDLVCNSPFNAPLLRRLTADPELRRLHREHLLRLTEPGWLEAFWAREDSALALREAWIREGEPDYRYDRGFLAGRAATLREHLLAGPCRPDTFRDRYWSNVLEERERLPLRPDVSVMAWAGPDSVWVENAHHRPVTVLAYGPGWAYREELEPRTLAAQEGYGPPPRVAFGRRPGLSARRVFVREAGTDTVVAIPVAPFAAPSRRVPREALQTRAFPESGVWRLSGTVRLDRRVRVPPGGRVEAAPGPRLMLGPGAGLVIESPAAWLGTAEAPVRVEGRPGNHGLLFLDSVRWRHVETDGLEAPATADWTLTGAVTMAGPSADLAHVRLDAGRAEDAINLVRTRYRILDLSVHNAASDAVDIDFGGGTVADLRVTGCGNDGLDVSGTELDLEGLRVTGAGDKALSLGEASRVNARDLDLRGATVGVSVKDGSRVGLDGLRLADCRIGLVAVRKKPRYALPRAVVGAWTAERVERPWLVEAGATVRVDGRVIPGRADVDLAELGY